MLIISVVSIGLDEAVKLGKLLRKAYFFPLSILRSVSAPPFMELLRFPFLVFRFFTCKVASLFLRFIIVKIASDY